MFEVSQWRTRGAGGPPSAEPRGHQNAFDTCHIVEGGIFVFRHNLTLVGSGKIPPYCQMGPGRTR